jgi:hypothetical protein
MADRSQPYDRVGIKRGRGGTGGGRSIKSGNITLNIGKLLEATASGVFTVISAAQAPMTIPFAALLLWCSLWRTAEVRISETEAAVLYVMWMRKNSDRDVVEEGLLDHCNAHLRKYERPVLSLRDIRRALNKLESIKTIERSSRDKRMWWLRECVSLTYE